jgi:hypothetical protein
MAVADDRSARTTGAAHDSSSSSGSSMMATLPEDGDRILLRACSARAGDGGHGRARCTRQDCPRTQRAARRSPRAAQCGAACVFGKIRRPEKGRPLPRFTGGKPREGVSRPARNRADRLAGAFRARSAAVARSVARVRARATPAIVGVERRGKPRRDSFFRCRRAATPTPRSAACTLRSPLQEAAQVGRAVELPAPSSARGAPAHATNARLCAPCRGPPCSPRAARRSDRADRPDARATRQCRAQLPAQGRTPGTTRRCSCW